MAARVSLVTFGRRTLRPLPLRTLGLLAALVLLLVAAAAFYVGNQPRLPPSIGLADFGLVAYASGGDIYTVDPITGVREAIVSGPESDREPRWSLDGTRIAFLRSSGIGEALVIFDPGSRAIIAATDTLIDPDDNSIAWSPDGRSVAVAASVGDSRVLYIVDVSTGELTPLPIDYGFLEAYWRPPDGRQIMFYGGKEPNFGLFLFDMDDGGVTEVAQPAYPGGLIRPAGWTADGGRVVFMRDDPQGRMSTDVLDLATGEEVIFGDVGYARISNDGSRMVALNAIRRPCVANLSGGPCVQIGQRGQTYDGTHAAGAFWSPDDRWIIVRLGEGATVLDPDGQDRDAPAWIVGGAESIQRVAP